MNIVFGLLGLAIILVVLSDVVLTTLSFKGSGLISGWLADKIWLVALALHRRYTLHSMLSYMGTAILVTIISLWTFSLWVGWSLFFMLEPAAIVNASTGEAATIMETFYFAGYTLITLGNGEYKPEGAFWQIMTLLTSTTGFFVITLSITFLLSVLPAVVSKRQLSSYIASLGFKPEDILKHSWDGSDCTSLTQHLTGLNSSVGEMAQQHLAYPVLHYFHSTNVRNALPVRIAALDEALSMLRHGVEDCRDTAAQTRPLRQTIKWFLYTLEEGFIDADDDVPEPSPLTGLAGLGLRLEAAQTYREAIDNESERRKLLRGYLHRDGWDWEDIWKT